LGYEILYCSRCRAQLRGREFEKGDAFRIDDQAVCKACAPELVKSLPPDKVQILLKQMVLAQGKAAPKTARHEPPSDAKEPKPSKSGPAMASLTPLWIGLAAVLLLVLGLAAWVIGGARQAPPNPPPAPRAATNPAPKSKEPAPAPPPVKEPKVAKEPEAPKITPTPGLVGYWRMDEGAGTSIADSSGNGASGTLSDGAAWFPGKLGTALSFDGEKAIVSVTSSGSMADLMKTGLTVSAWILPRANKRGHVVDKSNANMGWVLAFREDGRIQFSGDQYFGKEVSRFSSKALALNTWHHITATWDGDRAATHVHVLIDGHPAAGDGIDGVGAVREGSSPILSIGNRRARDRGFNGLIDDVRVYNRVLSPSEILALANGLPK
jgi:hypothetical protein